MGTALFVGGNRWSVGTRSTRVSWENAGAEKGMRKDALITKREKSSEGRSPRALEVERNFQGREKANTAERVAKPWGRGFPESEQRFRDASQKGSARKGARVRICCRVVGAQARCLVPEAGVDPDTP
jgi:hypothetical protein